MERLQRRQCYRLKPEEASKGKDSRKVGRLLSPWASYSRLWNKIFLATCVIGVLIDPLFLYIPVINERDKCLGKDSNMMITALLLRIVTDLFYVLHIVFRLVNAVIIAIDLKLSLLAGFPLSYLLIDILAIIPLPQVIILRYFSKLAGSATLATRKIINTLLLIQYVPRLLRVYLCAKELGRSFDSLTRRVWVRAAFFFFLYISFGHIFGAFWYFYAIFRETACWHSASKSKSGDYIPGLFDCRMRYSIKHVTYLDERCPTKPPNSSVYDFGVFSDAVKSGILTNMEFLTKFSRCFWWGINNLSSFGQNLDTSINVEENLFASLISILGLLLFLYLIGNVQTHIQLKTTNSEETRRKIMVKKPEIEAYLSSHDFPVNKRNVIERFLRRRIKDEKDIDVKRLFSLIEDNPQDNKETFKAWMTKIIDLAKHGRNTSDFKAEMWILKNGFTPDMTKKIMHYVRLRLQEGEDVDVGNILPILPSELGMSVKKLLCFPTLKKMPFLQSMDERVHETFCNYLKPVVYVEKSYIIRKEEPLDFILLVTHGIVWSFGSSASPMEGLQRGDFFGKELLEWKLMNSASYDRFPISEASLKCHTKVEGFALMAVDLKPVLSHCWSQFPGPRKAFPEDLKHFAAAFLQQGFRRYIRNKKAKARANQLTIVISKKA